jgi:hypothetical protein
MKHTSNQKFAKSRAANSTIAFALIALIGFVAAFTIVSCDNGTTTPPTKTASVGTQTGILTEGTAGEVTYTVTTANIANGAYTVTTANLPKGVTVKEQVTIANNSGTLTLEGDEETEDGTYATLTLTIDGVTSAAFTLTINKKDAKVVQVGTQTGTLTEGTAGEVTYTVTTANIEDGEYNADVANLPKGVTVKGKVTIANNSGTLTLEGDTTTVKGTTNTLTLTIDGTTSVAFTLEISEPPAKTVSAVYIAGWYYDSEWNEVACYWKDEVRTDLDVPVEAENSNATAITVSGNNVYIAGYHGTIGISYTACYWKDGVRTDLDSTGNAEAFAIAVSGNTVYAAGYYFDNK